MTTLKSLLLASALGFTALAATGAHAATYVSQSATYSSDPGVASHGQRTVITSGPMRAVGGRIVASESMMAVGTRKVGHVGGRPYPIEASRIENTTVNATRHGLVERTEVTTSGSGLVNINNSGGNYYTETDGSYYADPAFNVNVYSTGSFND